MSINHSISSLIYRIIFCGEGSHMADVIPTFTLPHVRRMLQRAAGFCPPASVRHIFIEDDHLVGTARIVLAVCSGSQICSSARLTPWGPRFYLKCAVCADSAPTSAAFSQTKPLISRTRCSGTSPTSRCSTLASPTRRHEPVYSSSQISSTSHSVGRPYSLLSQYPPRVPETRGPDFRADDGTK